MANLKKTILVLIGVVLLIAIIILIPYLRKKHLFEKSHDSIRIGMSIREVFESGLADYLILMGVKNVPSGTVPQKQPVSTACKRYVLDIFHFGSSFWVRVYCNMNNPSAQQVIPDKSFNREEFLQALDSIYGPWASSMEFRVESPAKRLFGVYDHYSFTTSQEGKIIMISPIVASP